MQKMKLGMCLLVSSLLTTASLTASASCGPPVSFAPDVSRTFSFEGVKWFRYDTTGADPNYSSLSSVWNNNGSTAAKLMIPLYGGHAPADYSRALRTLGVWVELVDAAATPTTCTLRAWDGTQTYVVSNSLTSACNMYMTAEANAYSIYANVRCTLPAKTSTHYSEIPRTVEGQWFW